MPVSLDLIKHYAPVFLFHQDERYFPCSIEHLLLNGTLHSAGGVTTISPLQSALADGSSDGGSERFVEVNASQFFGLPLQNEQIVSPIYYAVQDYADAVMIHYIVLFAYQGGQTVRAPVPGLGHSFNCIVNDFGIHQGDLERVAIVLSPNGHTVLAVEFEAHGDRTIYGPGEATWEGGSHPLVHVALNGHSMRNLAWQTSPIVEASTPAGNIISECGHGRTWAPHLTSEFKPLALAAGPQATKSWADFAGRLGAPQTNNFTSATRFDGSSLNDTEKGWVSLVGSLASSLSSDFKNAKGPPGPAERWWMKQPAAGTRFDRAVMVAQWTRPDLGQGSGGAFLTGRFHDSAKDSLVQLWSNDGQLAAIAYKFQTSGDLAVVSHTGDLGQGAGAIGWLKGTFLASPATEQVLQLWDSGGPLGMIVYGVDKDSQQLGGLWGTADSGQGTGGKILFFADDFRGDGHDNVLHLWDKQGQLGLVLYGRDGGGGLTWVWSEDTSEPADAVQWLVGNFQGDASADLLQCRSNEVGTLGMVLWGGNGSGGLAKKWSIAAVPSCGAGAIQWLVGDFNKDGKDEVLQCWDNGGKLGMILHGADGNGGMKVLWGAANTGHGSGSIQWLVGDFDGDGHDEVVQCWSGAPGMLGMILYHFDSTAGGMTACWGTHDVGEGPGAIVWFNGRFAGDSSEQILQLYDKNGRLGAIRYGTAITG